MLSRVPHSAESLLQLLTVPSCRRTLWNQAGGRRGGLLWQCPFRKVLFPELHSEPAN